MCDRETCRATVNDGLRLRMLNFMLSMHVFDNSFKELMSSFADGHVPKRFEYEKLWELVYLTSNHEMDFVLGSASCGG